MKEADAYRIAEEVIHPFQNKVDVAILQTLADRIVSAIMMVDKCKDEQCIYYIDPQFCGAKHGMREGEK